MIKRYQQLEDIIVPAVAALGYEFWGCEYHPQSRPAIVRVYIDSEHGISLGDCEKVSYQVSAALDRADPIVGEYHLEVSSPGLDRPLFNLAQCERFIGANVRIKMAMSVSGQHHFKGKLVAVTDDSLMLETKGEEQVCLLFANVRKANIMA